MKKVFTILLLAAFAGSASATEDSPVAKPIVVTSLQTTFKGATGITWSSAGTNIRAEFMYKNQSISAYFSEDGKLLSVIKNILSTQLPLMLEVSLRENYSGYWITNVIEFSTESGTDYYVSLENADQKLVLKSDQSNWNTHTKLSK